MQDPFIVGIRFQKVGKVYHFDAGAWRDLRIGDMAVVETSRGRQLGEVVQIVEDPVPPPEGSWKPIQRRASPRDLLLRQISNQKEIEAMINCRAKVAELKIEGVKIVAAEFTFDGSRLSFLYSTEADGKVDLNAVRNSMQRLYTRTHVEMRQIGPRDVAKLLGGMGACGMENRCCSMFLTEFSPISIKMAKEQGISLTPSEITGMCGRLRCCLVYEYEQYVEARKQLPKRGKRVVTPQGEGKVIDIYPLKQALLVEIEDKGLRVEFSHEEVQPWDELEALRRKSQAPCDRHEGGGCDCGTAGGSAGGTAGSKASDKAGGDAEPAAGSESGSTAYTQPAAQAPLETAGDESKMDPSAELPDWEPFDDSTTPGNKPHLQDTGNAPLKRKPFEGGRRKRGRKKKKS